MQHRLIWMGRKMRVDYDYKVVEMTPLKVWVNLTGVYEEFESGASVKIGPIPVWLKGMIEVALQSSDDVLRKILKIENAK